MRACSPSPTFPTSAFTVPAESAVTTRRAQGCKERRGSARTSSSPHPPIPVTTPILAHGLPFPARKAQYQFEQPWTFLAGSGAAGTGSLVGAGPAPRSSLNPRERLLEVRARGSSDVLAGYPAISRTAAPTSPAPPAPRRALRIRKCSSNRRSRVQNAHLGEEGAGPARQLRPAPAQWAAKAMISASTSARVAGSLWTSWRTPVYTRVRMSRRPASHRPLATR